ncbi:hypothetical protein, partial [Marinobacter alexandrii]|uniref:hypothetical protein n=1 Tax=Marinobacter alexandrii TaxID=2570351 RepID=UPI003296A082
MPDETCVAYLRPRLVSTAAAGGVWRTWLMSGAATGVRILPLPIFLRLPVLVPRTGPSPALPSPALTMLVLLLVLTPWLMLIGLLVLLLLLMMWLLLLLPPVPSGATARRATSAARVVARTGTGETPLSTCST